MNDDLISRNALLEKVWYTGGRIVIDVNAVKAAPAVDAVIPVRCAQCSHFKRNLENDAYCSCINGLTDPQEDDFCSYGERRTEGLV